MADAQFRRESHTEDDGCLSEVSSRKAARPQEFFNAARRFRRSRFQGAGRARSMHCTMRSSSAAMRIETATPVVASVASLLRRRVDGSSLIDFDSLLQPALMLDSPRLSESPSEASTRLPSRESSCAPDLRTMSEGSARSSRKSSQQDMESDGAKESDVEDFFKEDGLMLEIRKPSMPLTRTSLTSHRRSVLRHALDADNSEQPM